MAHPTSNWLEYVREVIACAVHQSSTEITPPAGADRPHNGVFVTLRIEGRLRGCMGLLDPTPPLAEILRDTAITAAMQDPRFPPLTPAEFRDLTIDISILSATTPMQSLDDLEIGKHGIIIQRGSRRGLFLPQVATDHNMTKEQFLSRCCSEKAGLADDAWKDANTEVLLFEAEVLAEAD